MPLGHVIARSAPHSARSLEGSSYNPFLVYHLADSYRLVALVGSAG